MDIRKLQRAIVDGLEDVKAQGIQVFDTEHISPLFERVIIASGTSNRQTKALAASVRDAVRAKGFQVMRTEGEGNGEWIIVDCGAAVVHVMQPAIREYYHLEEIWGDKPVKLKAEAPVKLVKAEEPAKPAAKKAVSKKAPVKKLVAEKAPAASAKKLAPAKSAAKKTAAAKTPAPAKKASVAQKVLAPVAAPAKKAAAKRAAPAKAVVTRSIGVKGGAVAKKAPAKKVAAKKVASKTVGAKSAPTKKAPVKLAPAKKAAPKKSPTRK